MPALTRIAPLTTDNNVLFPESSFDDLTGDQLVKMLNNVDLSDPAQASSAIDVVNGIVGGMEVTTEFANKYDTTTTTTLSNKITRLVIIFYILRMRSRTIVTYKVSLGTIHKPRGQKGGRGRPKRPHSATRREGGKVSQMRY